ncbi:MAG: GTP cyclohydrolase 1 type 2 [Saprospiraceae bacterium]|nr:MAG: GTP cyclohydrolase 1 type 2 [Saprospiraceae bacterium]
MKIKDLTNYLESIAPANYQESYDNAGLIVGDPATELSGVLVCLDSTEAVVEEAIAKKCNLIVAHHPIVFKGLKRLNGRNYVERTVIKAIRNEIAIYAIHTNLDNVYAQGVNAKIAEKLGLEDTHILAPKAEMKKLFTFVPATHSEVIRKALFAVGAGQVLPHNELSFSTLGVGSQDGQNGAQVKLEVVFPSGNQSAVLKALDEQFSGAAYDIMQVENSTPEVGSGMIGTFKKPMTEEAFLKFLKKNMQTELVRHTQLLGNKISKVAICGGAGSFLLSRAIQQKADVFITADYKYHEFFDADGKIVIADIGHFESEQFTIDLLYEIISEKFSNFALHCTEVKTNPVNYF